MKKSHPDQRVLMQKTSAEVSLPGTPSTHWFFRYKIYHLPFWLVYHYIWTVVNAGTHPVQVLQYILSSPKFLFYVIYQAIAVYFTLYFLVPKYLERGKYFPFLVYFAVTVTTAASLIVSGYYVTAQMKGATMMEMFGNDKFSHFFLIYALPSTLTSMFLAMSIKLTRNWVQSRKREQLLEKQKLENELKFLRSQLNPHFLFNTINSIFVLIHKNPDMASEALAKFSGLLRYQLYECNEDEIPLHQELHCVENYIELEQLRLDGRTLRLDVEFDPLPDNSYTIAPLLLIPFVENAFKHVSKRKERVNEIRIKLSFSSGKMILSIINTIDQEQKISREVMTNSGIGLTNVQRRLNLIYPNQHRLEIKKGDYNFTVTLELSLHTLAVSRTVVDESEKIEFTR